MFQRTRNFITPKLKKLLQNSVLNYGFQTIKIPTSKVTFSHRTSKFQLQSARGYTKTVGHSSKYYPVSPIELTEIKLREKFFDQKEFTLEQWHTIKGDITTEFIIVTKENFDSILMNSMLASDNIQLAQSFMNYLNHASHKPNLVTCLKYMVLCSRHPDICQQDEILRTFDKIKTLVDSSPVLDHVTVNCVVHGLCATDQWRKAFGYLKKLLQNDPLLVTKDALASAAVRNGEEALAWNIMTKWFKPAEVPDVYVIKAYIKFASSLLERQPQLADSYLSKLLQYLRNKNVVMKAACTEEINNYFERHPCNWSVSYTKVNRLSCCLTCHGNLEMVNLSMAELQQLQKVFFKRVMMKSDVFINSTQAEMDQFLNFIQKNEPFDIVVDGLNAAYTCTEMRQKQALATQLLEVVKRLTVSPQRVLILGRNYMRGWPRNIMVSISQRASMFFTKNVSEDDPLAIYAALMSGPDTSLVSSDLMRDHISNINDPKMIQLFKKWQLSHQIFLSNAGNGPVFQGPIKHNISIHGDMETGWHIPYDDEFVLGVYEELNNWLCIKRIK